MPNNLPESQTPDLREYFFVDNARVRMLVSQLQDGRPESSTGKTSRSTKLRVGLKFLGAESGSEHSDENTMALSDLYVSMLEEDAEALRMLKDVSAEASNSEFWKRGGARKRLKPGMLIRVTAHTTMMDPLSITQVWRNFSEVFGSSDNKDFDAALDGINSLYGKHLSVTVLPLGKASPTKAFVGVIDHNTDFSSLDRASLFSRLGPDPTELTSILQIARIPQEPVSGWSEDRILKDFKESTQQSVIAGRLDRSALDQLLNGIMKITEEYGLQSAPLWPAMAVTPLAVYRHVPAVP